MTVLYVLLAGLCLYLTILNTAFWFLGGFEELTGIRLDGICGHALIITMMFTGIFMFGFGIFWFVNQAVIASGGCCQ